MAKPSARASLRLMLCAAGSALAAAFVTAASTAWSHPIEGVGVAELLRSATTTSGAPITLPEGPLEAVVSRYSIAPYAALPVHKHPYVRLGYVMSGKLEVTNVETKHSRVFKAGEAIVEDIDQWHAAKNHHPQPVELLVIDLAPLGAKTTLQRTEP
ncbi:cupin domain-containing protein [Caulobacter segnis]|uniref:cupin domain-containing protein n=1 Tax=Caulobacter segnis TaxID=88688 RepID=UPI0028664C60|nr:cupin domain-containing protein [Caulobacter segnis]MDR6624438.1 quercetin dioxygenase-like cupin family protein [Caulobacter segnis]